jgi:hypothetical protein
MEPGFSGLWPIGILSWNSTRLGLQRAERSERSPSGLSKACAGCQADKPDQFLELTLHLLAVVGRIRLRALRNHGEQCGDDKTLHEWGRQISGNRAAVADKRIQPVLHGSGDKRARLNLLLYPPVAPQRSDPGMALEDL